jgi:type I restriction enzyme, S subunit
MMSLSALASLSPEAASQAGTRILPRGAVVASCVGNFGAASINSVDIVINQQLQAFIPGDQINAKFMRVCVACAKGYFEQIGTAATLTYVNQQGFENMPLALPPSEEQEAIVVFVARLASEIDHLVTEATHAIDLLQERRTALISAAVTGKIDVRKLSKHSERGSENLTKQQLKTGVLAVAD